MSQASTISTWSRDLRLAVVAIIAVATASAIGHLATYPNLAPWYAGRDGRRGISFPTRNFVHEIDDTALDPWANAHERLRQSKASSAACCGHCSVADAIAAIDLCLVPNPDI